MTADNRPYVELTGTMDQQITQAVLYHRFQLPLEQRRDLLNRWLDEHPDFIVGSCGAAIDGRSRLTLVASTSDHD